MEGTETFGWFPPAQLFDFQDCLEKFSKPSGKQKRIPVALQRSIDLALERSKASGGAQPKPSARRGADKKEARPAPEPAESKSRRPPARPEAAAHPSPPPLLLQIAAQAKDRPPRSKAPPRLRPERSVRAEPAAPPPPTPPPPPAPAPSPPPRSPLDAFDSLLPAAARRPESISAAALVRMAASGAKRSGLDADDGPPRRRTRHAPQPD
eukprot:tig00020603_g11761.t1